MVVVVAGEGEKRKKSVFSAGGGVRGGEATAQGRSTGLYYGVGGGGGLTSGDDLLPLLPGGRTYEGLLVESSSASRSGLEGL